MAHSRAEARLLQQPSILAPSAHPRGAFFIVWKRSFLYDKKRPSTENSAKGRLNSNAVPPLFFGKTDLLQRLRRQLFRNLVAVTKNRCPITGTTVKAYHAAAHSALRFQSHIPFSFAQVSFQRSGTLSVSRVNVLFFFLIFVRVLCTL